jgi:Leucine-rich repeat (LRR) protein
MKELLILLLSLNFIHSQIYDVTIPENDTASYNYADFRLWISDSTDTLKGIYWYMHPNNGDSRNIVDDSNYQILASNKDFALMGAHIFNMHMNTGIGDAVIAATDSFAVLSNYEELEFIPFFINGYSWGGQFAFHFTKWIPERVLGFITQKGGYHDSIITNLAIQVPGLMFIGENDLDYRIENLTNIFFNHRPLGAKWILAMEQGTGHSQINDLNFLNSYFNTVTDLRIPDNVNVFEPITLNTLPDSIGWLGNQSSWIIGSWECYNGVYDSSSWLPSKAVGLHWQNFVSEDLTSDTSSCHPYFDSTYTFFKIGIHGEDENSDFIIVTNDSSKIDQCRSQLELSEDDRDLHINGYIDYTDGGFNNPWNWHIIPNEWVLAEMSIGLCNGTPEQIESDLDYWVDNVGQLCNWGSFIKDEIISDSLCNSSEVELWNECYSIENTTDLNLSNSGLLGVIPPEIGNLTSLINLDLSNNQLTGSIPPEIGNLTSLINLDLSNNQLTGVITESICNLINLGVSYLQNNQLCPPYPSCIENYIGLQDTTNCEELAIINEMLPVSYKLYNPYPNPFNPSTTMEFDIGNSQFISLNIYDLNGRLIEEFFIKHLLPGSHIITWEPKNITSGIYFIELLAENFRSTQKLILLK